MALMDDEEREQVEYIYRTIPEQDRVGITPDDILFVLDKEDDYLESVGLLEYDDQTDEATYLDGEVNETEQLEFILHENCVNHRNLTFAQIQLILDAELQYGIEQGWYEEED